ncbi:MAG: protein-export chaperone SecB [Syntrophobacterales bacterium]|jgi:preprotein translocase subunit SecB|nr:protein-export chaperone SecB [Syntrophobacterales bacterium]
MPEKKDFNISPHPIQLISLNIEELSIKVKKHPQAVDLKSDSGEFNLRTGHSEYDEENQIIQVGIKLEIKGKEGQENPFDMTVAMSGIFKVDETRFKKSNIEDFANRNAPIILYPYLREQAYALTIRCGFPGIIIPLLTVPIFKIETPKKAPKGKTKHES